MNWRRIGVSTIRGLITVGIVLVVVLGVLTYGLKCDCQRNTRLSGWQMGCQEPYFRNGKHCILYRAEAGTYEVCYQSDLGAGAVE